jgi:hypothetical protein
VGFPGKLAGRITAPHVLACAFLAAAAVLFFANLPPQMRRIHETTKPFAIGLPRCRHHAQCSGTTNSDQSAAKKLNEFCQQKLPSLCVELNASVPSVKPEAPRFDLVCANEDACGKLLSGYVAAIRPDIDSLLGLLNAYFAGLCVAVGYIYKKAIDARALRLPFLETTSLLFFGVSAYCVIFFSYWSRDLMARQASGIAVPEVKNVFDAVESLGVATTMAAFCAAAVLALALFTSRQSACEEWNDVARSG